MRNIDKRSVMSTSRAEMGQRSSITLSVSRSFTSSMTIVFSLICLICLPCACTERTVGSPCIPMEVKTALIIGQDYFSILNYTAVLGGNPFGVMSYTGEGINHTGNTKNGYIDKAVVSNMFTMYIK